MTREESCEDTISRQAVLDMQYRIDDSATLSTRDVVNVEDIENSPSVTPQPKIGRWIPIEYDGYADGSPVWDKWECSKCRWEHSGDEESLTAFCPNCGAKMEEENELL